MAPRPLSAFAPPVSPLSSPSSSPSPSPPPSAVRLAERPASRALAEATRLVAARDRRGALAALRDACREAPADVVILERAAMLLARLGAPGKAAQVKRRVLALARHRLRDEELAARLEAALAQDREPEDDGSVGDTSSDAFWEPLFASSRTTT